MSQTKKKNSSTTNLLRKDSIGSISKIYGVGGSAIERINSDINSPKSKNDSKLSHVLKKRGSKSSLNKSKI